MESSWYAKVAVPLRVCDGITICVGGSPIFIETIATPVALSETGSLYELTVVK
jgi:hypothetical protein